MLRHLIPCECLMSRRHCPPSSHAHFPTHKWHSFHSLLPCLCLHAWTSSPSTAESRPTKTPTRDMHELLTFPRVPPTLLRVKRGMIVCRCVCVCSDAAERVEWLLQLLLLTVTEEGGAGITWWCGLLNAMFILVQLRECHTVSYTRQLIATRMLPAVNQLMNYHHHHHHRH